MGRCKPALTLAPIIALIPIQRVYIQKQSGIRSPYHLMFDPFDHFFHDFFLVNQLLRFLER